MHLCCGEDIDVAALGVGKGEQDALKKWYNNIMVPALTLIFWV